MSIKLNFYWEDVMKEYTSLNDKLGKPINEGDVLYNGFIGDFWIVEEKNGLYFACLVPNSGFIEHPEGTKYPAYIEELDAVCENFEVVGSKYDTEDFEIREIMERVKQMEG